MLKITVRVSTDSEEETSVVVEQVLVIGKVLVVGKVLVTEKVLDGSGKEIVNSCVDASDSP
jgi:hypothetical protein